MSGATPESERGGPGAPVVAALVLVAVVHAITLLGVERRGFWIIDNANKFLQVEALLSSGYQDWSIPWPGVEVDPDFEFNPIPPPFAVVLEERLYSFYSPFFATLSSIPYRFLGIDGLYLIPWLSTLLLLGGIAQAGRELGLLPAARATAVFVAGLATPLWFYSATFWEHAPAGCLVTWATVAWLRFLRGGATRDFVVASALATFAVWFRDELYLFCGVLAALGFLMAPEGRRASIFPGIATMALAILPLWIFQWVAVGNPLGLHVVSQWPGGPVDWLFERPLVVYLLFVAFTPAIWSSLLLAAPFVVGLVANPAWSADRFRLALPAAATVATAACGVSLLGYLRSDGPMEWMNQTNSLFSTSPILLLAFVRRQNPDHDARGARAVWWLVLSYSVVYSLAAPSAEASAGIHWGNRLLFGLYPLLALLAAANLVDWLAVVRRPPALAAVAVGLALLMSVAAQAGSIALLDSRKRFSERLSQAVMGRPEPVLVSDVWWAPQDLHAVFLEKPIFLLGSADAWPRLRDRLVRAGVEEVLFVTATGRTRTGTLVARIEDSELGFFGLDLARVPLR